MIDQPKPREFTGKHMILVISLFFGTIITVNLIMAYFATTSWTGLVVKNSYVASQGFNEKLEAIKQQKALGWQPSLSYQQGAGSLQKGKISYQLLNAANDGVVAEFAEVELRRPSFEGDDRVITLLPQSAGNYSADFTLAGGAWDVFVSLVSEEGQRYVYRERIIVK